jgi:hypothetical protein
MVNYLQSLGALDVPAASQQQSSRACRGSDCKAQGILLFAYAVCF